MSSFTISYPDGFAARIQKDFAAKLAKGTGERPIVSAPKVSENIMVTLVEKPTRSVAYSLGHAISVRRGDPDYAALHQWTVYQVWYILDCETR